MCRGGITSPSAPAGKWNCMKEARASKPRSLSGRVEKQRKDASYAFDHNRCHCTELFLDVRCGGHSKRSESPPAAAPVQPRWTLCACAGRLLGHDTHREATCSSVSGSRGECWFC